jgi:hypothetical protein
MALAVGEAVGPQGAAFLQILYPLMLAFPLFHLGGQRA